jgi:transcriptional regulator with GAF, ATPase, and Fis domain
VELQCKPLRVLQAGEFERVGEDRARRVNVRVIASTNQDLEKEVAASRFRQGSLFSVALEKSNGKIYGSDGAAELLGMRPTTLSSKIATLKIKRSKRRS